jgi:hypothetical protein
MNHSQKRKTRRLPEHAGKRQNLPSHIDSDVYTISYWTEFGCWPEVFFSSTDGILLRGYVVYVVSLLDVRGQMRS